MQKYIFLDLDGVLNTENHIKILRENGKRTTDQFGYLFDPIAVKNLGIIIDNTHAEIVISSSWRFAGLVAMCELWEVRKLPGKMIDITPMDWFDVETVEVELDFNPVGGRGKEIQQWLSKYATPFDKYVIIDDCNDMLPSQQPYFVETNPIVGITQHDVLRSIEILGIT